MVELDEQIDFNGLKFKLVQISCSLYGKPIDGRLKLECELIKPESSKDGSE